MALVQRSRFGTWLKNLTGFRGPFGMNLDSGVTPVYDLGQIAAELDDEQAYWLMGFSSAAVAAQFSFAQISVGAGRAIVDGFALQHRTQAGVRAGLTQSIAGAGSPVLVRNNFLGLRTPAFSLPAMQLGAVTILTGSQAADPFTPVGVNSALNVDQLGNVAPGQQTFLEVSTDLAWVLTPGFSWVISPAIVNCIVQGSVWGRFLADQT